MSNDVTQPSQEQIMTAAQVMSNAGYNSASALQVRLDMDQQIAEFERYLLGVHTQVVVDELSGQPREVHYRVGEGLVNERGRMAIIGWLQIIANKHTVMGNFLDEDWYGRYMCDLHKDTWCDMMKNRVDYGIDLKKIQGIHSKFMMYVRLLLTRPIGDKERLGMNNTTKIQETTQNNSVQRGGGVFSGLGLFGGKR